MCREPCRRLAPDPSKVCSAPSNARHRRLDGLAVLGCERRLPIGFQARDKRDIAAVADQTSNEPRSPGEVDERIDFREVRKDKIEGQLRVAFGDRGDHGSADGLAGLARYRELQCLAR